MVILLNGKVYDTEKATLVAFDTKGGDIMRRRPHPCNRYQNYELETNQDAYEYLKRQYEREEKYWWEISRMNDEMLYGKEDW